MKRIWVDREKCLGCKTCELSCAIERDSVSKTLFGAAAEQQEPVPRVGVFGQTENCLPLQCRHCQDAPCLRACPSGAMQRDEETELVFIDQKKCRGCYMCVMVCPFGSVRPSPAYKLAVKCDACRHREEPACVASCPTGALVHADENGFNRVLAAKRNQVALYVGETVQVNKPVDIDFVREDE